MSIHKSGRNHKSRFVSKLLRENETIKHLDEFQECDFGWALDCKPMNPLWSSYTISIFIFVAL